MSKHSLTPSSLVAFNHAAAGHDGVLSDPSGALVIKPCTPAEIAFYESASAHPEFAHYMPTFMGTLSLSPHPDPAAAAAALTANSISAPASSEGVPPTTTNTASDPSAAAAADWTPSQGATIPTNTAIVLSNLTYGFQHPNILDLKLGARLWDDNAPPAKRQRLDAVAASSTSSSLGFRIAGMRVWQGPGIAIQGRFPEDVVKAMGYKIYGKEYGRGFKGREDVLGAFEEFLHVKTARVTPELAKKVVKRLLSEVQGLEAVLSGQESRMYSASVLFVYEGDGEILKREFELEERESRERAAREDSHKAQDQNKRTEHEDDELDDDDDEEEAPPIAVAKLIDFAHAEWVPGQGPDENALQGVRSIIDILTQLSSS